VTGFLLLHLASGQYLVDYFTTCVAGVGNGPRCNTNHLEFSLDSTLHCIAGVGLARPAAVLQASAVLKPEAQQCVYLLVWAMDWFFAPQTTCTAAATRESWTLL